MPSRGLPVNIDSAYADDTEHPDVKIHQGHHDVIHLLANLFDTTAPANGDALVWSSATGLWIPAAISGGGGPGPAGPAGPGFVYKGPWSGATSYVLNDVVLSNGWAFVSRTSHSNSAPQFNSSDQGITSTNWFVFAAGGEDGTDGAPGQSVTGPVGPAGAPGPAAEALGSPINVNGTIDFDFGDFSAQVVTLTGNSTFTFSESSGRPYSAFTIILRMGSGGPYTVNWPTMRWQTVDGEPDISDMNSGDERDIIIRQINGVYVGFFPGEGGVALPPPPDVYPTLAAPTVLVSAADSTAKATNPALWPLGGVVSIGNKKGGTAYVVTTRDDNIDPGIPTLTGGGMTTWNVVASQVGGVASTTRRRITEFAARQDVAGAASQFVVSVADALPASHTGAMLIVHTTAGIVPTTWLNTILAKAAFRQSSDATETSTAPKITLGAADQASNRAVAAIADNGGTTTFTPDSGWSLIGSQLDMINPTIHLRVLARFDTFDTTPSGVISAAVIWFAVGSEWEQG